MKNVFLCILISMAIKASGQDWFSQHAQGENVPGNIITIAGDTISGLISYDYPVVMQKRISFQSGGNPNPIIYQPKDIRGYSCDNMIWISAFVIFETYNGPIKFNRFGILYSGKGSLQLMRIFPERDKTLRKMSSTKAESIYKNISLVQDEKSFKDLYIKKLEDPAESVNSRSFKKEFINNIARRISDDKDLMNKVNNKIYKYSDLKTILREYNDWYLKNRYKNSR